MRDRRRVKGTVKTTVDGITFDSKREAKRYSELKLLERAGEISNLQLQVPVDLLGKNDHLRTPTGRPMRYIADFKYWDHKLNIWVYEDAKGYPTETYTMKKAVLAAMGMDIKEV